MKNWQPTFFVTSGYGFWGIPMRLGSQSEVIIIDVKGIKKSGQNDRSFIINCY